MKVASTVLKSSGGSDPFADFNRLLALGISFLCGCPPLMIGISMLPRGITRPYDQTKEETVSSSEGGKEEKTKGIHDHFCER